MRRVFPQHCSGVSRAWHAKRMSFPQDSLAYAPCTRAREFTTTGPREQAVPYFERMGLQKPAKLPEPDYLEAVTATPRDLIMLEHKTHPPLQRHAQHQTSN